MSTNEAASGQTSQYLSYVVGGTDFGMPILKVKEILQFDGTTPVPGTPASIRGVINVRGAVVPIVDLAVKFGRGASAPTKRTCVLVVETATPSGPLTLGVLADAVNEVVDLRPEDIEPPPAFGSGVALSHVVGMGKVGKGFCILLDIDRVLSATEQDVAASAPALQAAAERGEATPATAPA